jgi:hypothetical protein
MFSSVGGGGDGGGGVDDDIGDDESDLFVCFKLRQCRKLFEPE